MGHVRRRFWFEIGTAVASALLAVVTLFWKDWIEVTGWDPDNHSGAAEWWIVVVLAAVSTTSAIAARIEWRLHAAASS
jgi:undecaprenyl pyrophosphate phosphatase UppP